MKAILPLLAIALCFQFVGCASHKDQNTNIAVGADKDKHGCIASAGYSWCERTKHCERPWELAKEAGFPNTTADFERHCQN
jgi:hypothetical protein